MSKVLVIGAGWLGDPLANHFAALGQQVLATHRSRPPSTVHSIPLDLLQALSDEVLQNVAGFNPDVIVGCFPPGYRHLAADDKDLNPYLECWEKVLVLAKQCQNPIVVMMSSSAVYPDCLDVATEQDANVHAATGVNGFSDKSIKLLATEQLIIESSYRYLILRSTGLIGPNRHPSRFVAKLSTVSQAAPVNMVHLNDVIGAITHCINWLTTHPQKRGDTINITTPNTCSKAEFYQAALDAADFDLPLPTVSNKPAKRVSADKLLSIGYHFEFEHVLDALNAIKL
jgi:nucleoside-diphosphate-sugar epimerase